MPEVIEGFTPLRQRKAAALHKLREAQARLQDTPVGPERERVRAEVDHWDEEVKQWSRAEARTLWRTKLLMSIPEQTFRD